MPYASSAGRTAPITGEAVLLAQACKINLVEPTRGTLATRCCWDLNAGPSQQIAAVVMSP